MKETGENITKQKKYRETNLGMENQNEANLNQQDLD